MAYALQLVSLQTPVGTIVVTGIDDALIAVHILADDQPAGTSTAPASSPAATAARQLTEYFGGMRPYFDVPLAPMTGARGMALSQGIIDIPYGATTTYGALAASLGSAPRAIGQTCRSNPFPIIVPCHRITSTNGPEYYSGGNGAATKAWLIDFEHRTLPYAQRTRLL
jgi:methylated-DNA-[protein]-cysteine S-methyltransferase